VSGWPLHELSDAVEFNPRTPKGIPASQHLSFVPMAAVDEIHGAIIDRHVREFGVVSKGFPTFANGDVLFAKITPCMENGKAAIASDLVNGIGRGLNRILRVAATSQCVARIHFSFCPPVVVQRDL
jgi:type I restriction enzyme S subunit